MHIAGITIMILSPLKKTLQTKVRQLLTKCLFVFLPLTADFFHHCIQFSFVFLETHCLSLSPSRPFPFFSDGSWLPFRSFFIYLLFLSLCRTCREICSCFYTFNRLFPKQISPVSQDLAEGLARERLLRLGHAGQ